MDDQGEIIHIQLPFCNMDIAHENNLKYIRFQYKFQAPINELWRRHGEHVPLEKPRFYAAAATLLLQNYIDSDEISMEVYENEHYVLQLKNTGDDEVCNFLRYAKDCYRKSSKTSEYGGDICIRLGSDFDIYRYQYKLIFDLGRIDDNEIYLYYSDGMIQKEYIELIAENYETLIQSLILNQNARLRDLTFLSEKEKYLIQQFNKTECEYKGGNTIIDLFQEQVKKYPNQMALFYKGEEITYKELNNRVKILVHRIKQECNIEQGSIGIYMHRSVEMIVSMLGIMQSGCCYVPIDPDYPVERIEYMIQKSGLNFILIHHRTSGIELPNIEIVNVEEEHHGIDPFIYTKASDLAYIIFTSGSTGNPKGVQIEQRQVVHTLKWRRDYYHFSDKDVILQLPSFSFDSSVEDIFTPLISGAALVLLDSEERFDIKAMEQYILEQKITHLMMLPSYYKILLEHIPKSLTGIQSITLAGEAVDNKLVETHFSWLPNTGLYTECGPTECSVCANAYEFDKKNIRILLGSPISNVKCHVVNRWGQIAPIGGIGESWIESPGVARGYLGEVQRDKFGKIGDYSFNQTDRIYKSGDMVKWTYDGYIEFVGRKDNQVKINGYRIELAEVEKHIMNLQSVRDAVVAVNEKGQKYLEAFVILDNHTNVEEIRGMLSKKIPRHMIPARFNQVKELKRLPNGKVDRLGFIKSTEKKENRKYTEIEQTLLAICEAVLESDMITLNQSLEQYGVTSLKIISILYRIENQLRIRLTLAQIYKFNTIGEIAQYIEKHTTKSGCEQMYFDALGEAFYGTVSWDKAQKKLTIETKKTVNMDEIITYIEEKFPDNLYPNSINLNGAACVSETKAVSVTDMIKDLENQISQFRRGLLEEGELICAYPFSGMQSGHIMIPNRYTGDIFVIRNTMSTEKITTYLRELIASQSLLKSSPQYVKKEWEWNEFQPIEELPIPFVDFIGLKEADQYERMRRIYEEFYFIDYNKKYKEKRTLPYTMILIRKTWSEHYLLYFSDHIIYDEISYEIIKNSLENLSVIKPRRDFRDYLKVIETSLETKVKEEELIERFDMDTFCQNLVTCHNSLNKRSKSKNIKIKLRVSTTSSKCEVLSGSMQIYSGIISSLTGVNRLPVCLLNYGRQYREEKYFDIIGEFIDIIPILADSENIESTIHQLNERIHYLSSNNINISTIIFCKKIRAKYKKFLKRFMPIGELYTPNFLKFNYVEYRNEMGMDVLKRIFQDANVVNYAQRNEGIVCEVFHIDDKSFEMNLYSDYEITKSDLIKSVEGICKKEKYCIEIFED